MPDNRHYQQGKHRHWREKVLRKAKFLCERCRRYGKNVSATTAHHIKPVDEYPALAYDVDNGEALCDACHNKEHPEKGGRR